MFHKARVTGINPLLTVINIFLLCIRQEVDNVNIRIPETAASRCLWPHLLSIDKEGNLVSFNPVSKSSRACHTDAAGFVSFAGNFGGQGSTLSALFSGQSLFASSYYASSASAFESWPAAYMQLADPKLFNHSEVFLEASIDGISIL